MGIKAFGIECFEFNLNGSPQSILLQNHEVEKEIWCYRPLNHSNYKTMIFNYDGKKISDKLGILIGKENNFLFYDQYLGKLRVIEQIGSSFNPYQIPLSSKNVKKGMKSGEDIKKISLVFSQAQIQDLDKMIQSMINSDKKTLDFSKKPGINSINDIISDEEVYLPDDQLPLDGYWWPFRDTPMINSEKSPIRLYDLYVNFKTGQDPKSSDWEESNHAQDTFWGGHCNGWVASTILYGFFEQSLVLNLGDERETVVIDPLEIQGMRTEHSYCVKRAFYGKRYNDFGDDLRDIFPADFHKNIRYYLKELGKPIALDRIPNEIVDNSIFSGYKLKVEKLTENKYHVTATMRTHYYSENPVYVKKVATIKELKYPYTLETDKDGNITGGEWDDDLNPDFLWVPLAQMDCKGENPNINPDLVEEMIQTLPKIPYGSN
jgi:hypothetical protein